MMTAIIETTKIGGIYLLHLVGLSSNWPRTLAASQEAAGILPLLN